MSADRVCANPSCGRSLAQYRANRRWCSDICKRAAQNRAQASSATSLRQSERVLRALERNPARGITAVDFALPDVIDGGPPIMRFAARILELREQGRQIVSGERRQKCVVYRLKADVSEAQDAA